MNGLYRPKPFCRASGSYLQAARLEQMLNQP